MLKLECIEGPNQGTSYSKPGALLTVGRTSKSKIHIPDASISEKHGQLEWNGAVWLVQDVGSSNGTTVNGNSLVANGELANTQAGYWKGCLSCARSVVVEGRTLWDHANAN